jgi:hypothetical protein
MISPGKTFRESDLAKGWQSIVDSNQFEAAATAAMAEMQLASNPTNPAAVGVQLEGAKKFLELLMGLTTPSPARKPKPEGLNYKA